MDKTKQLVESLASQMKLKLTEAEKENLHNFVQAFETALTTLSGKVRNQELTRPEIYATDADYIIPRLDEIDFTKFANEYSKGDFTPVMDEVDSKLQRRMEYYEQELAKGNLSIEVLEELRIKTDSAISNGYEITESVEVIIETNRFLTKDEQVSLRNKYDALQKILGFYTAMQDIIADDIDNLRESEDDRICDCKCTCKEPSVTDGVQRLINLLGGLR